MHSGKPAGGYEEGEGNVRVQIGSVLASGAVVAGLMVLSASSWAGHVDATRKDPYVAVLDQVLPVDGLDGGIGTDLLWRATSRVSFADPAKREVLLTAWETSAGNVVVTLRQPRSRSIRALVDKAVEQSGEMGSRAISSIDISTWRFTPKTCPELAKLARQYRRMKIPTVLPTVLVFHATHYEVVLESQLGARTEMDYFGYTSDAPGEQPFVLLEWVDRLERTVRSCRPE